MATDKKGAGLPFAPDEEQMQATRAFIRSLVGDGEGLSGEEREKLAVLAGELERRFEQAFTVYQHRFADMPSVQSVRARWQARQISSDDPIFMMVEFLSISDARSALALSQIADIVHAFSKMANLHAKRVAMAANEVNQTRAETARYARDLVDAREAGARLANALAEYGKAIPGLLEAMGDCHRTAESSSRRARVELMGIGALLLAVGAGLGVLAFRLFFSG
jgi:hypothetical protein